VIVKILDWLQDLTITVSYTYARLRIWNAKPFTYKLKSYAVSSEVRHCEVVALVTIVFFF